MNKITTLGIDLAKQFFQLHGADESGKVILRKTLSRRQLSEFVAQLPVCLIAMEACGGSHFWARKFREMGHEVRLISPQFVKPFVKSNKNDANDAEAIVEAALRPSMRFVAIKTTAQQDTLAVHRIRERLIGARTALVNEIRGLLGEYGIIIPQGIRTFRKLLPEIIGDSSNGLSFSMRSLFTQLRKELNELDEKISSMENNIEAHVESHEITKRLMAIPGVGPITASAMVASIGDPSIFRNGRELSGWLGIVPRQNSSGGKSKMGGISKRGDKYLRKLLIHGARSALTRTKNHGRGEWLIKLRERRGFNRACVALANKNARVIWALMKTGESFQEKMSA